MRKPNSLPAVSLAAFGMFILILDAKTAFQGATEGISLCLRTVIPSLFPFFVLSSLLTGNLSGKSAAFLHWVGSMLGIPQGAERIWITGLLGGYPVGAKCVFQAYQDGFLSRRDACRLLGFCSNAGPAFIFGMAASFFPSGIYAWLLLAVQIIASALTGYLLPEKSSAVSDIKKNSSVTWNHALQSSLRAMAGVCGWIVLFRVILSVCQRWFLWLLPDALQVVFIGVLELSNGILSLSEISSFPLRFVFCAAMLNLGGVCVAMQTLAVTGELGFGSYLHGKCLQGLISTGLSVLICVILFRLSWMYCVLPLFTGLCIGIYLWRKSKKTVAIPRQLVYNE